ncbi:MAG: class I SAM-dependent rRNA methyltransferase [Alcanivoracaceae bacterium]|nr:class I SAM-dependent rRNA methyltransferase [Alcanivoracaceae bacterium]
MSDIAQLKLKRGEERRLRAGHVWVYSNEVDVQATPLTDLAPGQEVQLVDQKGKSLGRAYANPHSLICARLYSRKPKQAFDRAFIAARIKDALALRETLIGVRFYRLVFGESDGLPGIVIDRFDDVFVIQSGTAGAEQVQDIVADVLKEQFEARAVVARNESAVRELEKLPLYTRALIGEMPDEVSVDENAVKYLAPLAAGQKTGWFYDHRSARKRLIPLVQGKRVLDVFSYCGAWGVLAAAHGASEVTCVDSSELALDYVHKNAALNGVDERIRSIQGDAFDVLKALLADGEKFDVVVLDPPAFIKRKKDFKKGLQGYHALNELGVRLVQPGGMLISASCSMHLRSDQLLDTVRSAARHNDRQVQVFASEGQGEDHPVQPAIPETSYLKSWFTRILPNT